MISRQKNGADKTAQELMGDFPQGAVGVQSRPALGVNRLIGRSAAFKEIIRAIETIAPRQCPVIVVGETGTGKELVAHQIHRSSHRSKNVFVPVDCTALTGQLFESQLFGHVKGAFTGAVSDALGFFRAADSGTIFLDEIGELPLGLQVKLLRVLQESCVIPVGSTKSYSLDVRVICATNRHLKQMVLDGSFRADLYFRLGVVQIELPPLREREEDIIFLAEYFLDRQALFYNEAPKILSLAAKRILIDYNWPGNVRELANVMEHAHIISDSNEIEPSAFPDDILTMGILPEQTEGFPTLDQTKKKLVVCALQAANGRKMAAAKLLRIDHRKLSRLVKKYKLQPTWK